VDGETTVFYFKLQYNSLRLDCDWRNLVS